MNNSTRADLVKLKISKDNANKIREFYEDTLSYLIKSEKDIKSASSILYKKMPLNLYDLSVSISDSQVEDSSMEALKELIKTVQDLIEDKEEDIEPELLDDFGKNF